MSVVILTFRTAKKTNDLHTQQTDSHSKYAQACPKNWTVNSRSDTRKSLVLIKTSVRRRRLIVEKRACPVLAGGKMGGGRGRRQSTANDENTATAATAATLLRNE